MENVESHLEQRHSFIRASNGTQVSEDATVFGSDLDNDALNELHDLLHKNMHTDHKHDPDLRFGPRL